MQALYILDGYGLVYRSYYAFSGRPLNNAAGENVAAILAFYRSLFAFFKEQRPSHFMVALDCKEKNFRYNLYPEYKANRQKAPADLHSQTAIIEELLAALNLQSVRVEGYEADDVIATVALSRKKAGKKTVIVSSDKDLMQLIDDDYVTMLRPGSKGFTLYDSAKVYEEKQVKAGQIRDYLAIVGDSSDNIPGVAGLGPKAAEKLLQSYENLDEIYKYINQITPAGVQTKLAAQKDNAYLSYLLATLKEDVPLPNLSEDALKTVPNYGAAIEIFERAGIPSLVEACRKELANPTLAGPVINQPEAKPKKEVKNNPLLFAMPNRLTSYDGAKQSYQLLDSLDKIQKWAAKAAEATLMAFDTETDGLSHTAKVVGFSFCYAENEAVYIPLKAPNALSYNADDLLAILKPLLENPKLKLIGQNIKFDYKITKKFGITIQPYFDTMLAAWLLDTEGAVGMDYLAERYLAYKTIKFEEVVPKKATFNEVPLAEAAIYAAEDADITFKLYHKLKPLIEEHKLTKVFYDIEMPLLTILAEMELTGIQLNVQALNSFGGELTGELTKLEEVICNLADVNFNLQSPKQLAEVLFDKLKLPEVKKRSTDVNVLEELAPQHEIARQMLKYRTLIKLKTTYVDALPKESDSNGKIHTDFIQTGAATGRLASRNPNLQNIPVREDNGRRIRTAFEAATGNKLISADYSQIELVALAYLAGDERMIEVFKAGRDLHRETAAFIFGLTPAEITAGQRSVAKAINFGVVYGMSAFRLSNELKISRKEAQSYIDNYFTTYNKVKSFMGETLLKAEELGGVHTIMGRFRPIPFLFSRNNNERSMGERMAINTVVQGSAADIVKLAMIKLDKELKAKNLPSKLLLQVHDEIIVEAGLAEEAVTINLMKEVMTAVPLTLPIPMTIGVSVSSANNWGELK
ncbi:MAG: DNA polymerase I [Spirochaetaceae bacterium]|nr:DNA polymerase I [Spirochaetaceae bacterium]